MDIRLAKLRKKLRSYRAAKIGAIVLSVFSLLGLLGAFYTGNTEGQSIAPLYAATFVWPAIAYICHLKAKLIRIELSEFENLDCGQDSPENQ